MKKFKYAYFNYVQEVYKAERQQRGLYGNLEFLFDKIVKFDHDFYSDTNLLVLATELRVFNPMDFLKQARADPEYLMNQDQNLRGLPQQWKKALSLAFSKSIHLLKEIALYIRSSFKQELAQESISFWNFSIINKFKLRNFQILLGDQREQRSEEYSKDYEERVAINKNVEAAKRAGNKALEEAWEQKWQEVY